MNKFLLMAVAIVLSATTVFAANPHNGTTIADTAKKAKAAKVIYTCPMHTDVVAYKPGKCPKPGCGMTLVKKSDLKKKSMKM